MIEKFKRNQITPDTHEISLKINEIIDWIEIHKVITGGQHNSLDLIYKRLETLEDKLNSCISLGELGLIKERLDNLEKSFEINRSCNVERFQILEKRLSDLEQSPIGDNFIKDRLDLHKEKLENIYDYIEYFKEKAIFKPDYDPNDMRFKLVYKPLKCTDEIAKEGTFEWALIQLKSGKNVKRKAQESWMCIYMDSNSELNQFNGKGVTSHDRIDWKMLLENDWEIVK